MSPQVAERLSEHVDLVEAPINPAWVVAGTPVARAKTLASNLGRTQVALWDCTAGSFRWQFGPCDETVHILEGSVTVTDGQGRERLLQTGDVALFKAGSTSHWTVESYVKKLAVMHDRRWLPRRAAAHLIAKVRNR